MRRAAQACWDRSPASVAAFLAVVLTLVAAIGWIAGGESASSARAAEPSINAASPPRGKSRAAGKGTEKAVSAAVGTAQPAAPLPAIPVAADAGPDIAGKLKENGAGVCASAVNRLAAGAMGGVTGFNTASHWMVGSPDRRAVSVLIGQRFNAAGAVPFGATGIFAAPNGTGSCDGVAVQVVPSPLPCAQLRDALSARGRQIGDLAGLPLMEDAGGQTLLVPTAANTCVLLGMKSSYAG